MKLTRQGWIACGLALATMVGAQAVPLAPLAPTLDQAPIEASGGLTDALQRGHWSVACRQASATLAEGQPALDALGVFALCAALRHDQQALTQARARQPEAEPEPYYRELVAAVVELQAEQAAPAARRLAGLLTTHPTDPLVQYFAGEAHIANGDALAARRAFDAVLDVWPAHAPALLALSKLDAADAKLPQAIARMEQATQLDPQNRDYWRWLAELCTQAGQTGRAQAIVLQRLQVWSPPAP